MTNPITQPLAGKRVVVTRTREQASELALRLRAAGAEALELPVFAHQQGNLQGVLADVMLELASYDWIVFTSANGVRYFFEEFFPALRGHPIPRRTAHRPVGEGTGRRIVDLQPADRVPAEKGHRRRTWRTP